LPAIAQILKDDNERRIAGDQFKRALAGVGFDLNTRVSMVRREL
jgi:hypothetical protein